MSRTRIKRILLVMADMLLAAYLFFAMTSFNTPTNTDDVCVKVNIDVADKNTNGFLSAKEIKAILERERLYPLGMRMSQVSPRLIEEALRGSPFVKEAECCKTLDGHVSITIMQQLPAVRIKSSDGDDYYLDERGGIMPNTDYTSDLIVASGHITRRYAKLNLVHIANWLMENDLWRNQIEQIYLRPDEGIELVPRVGGHVIYIGQLPAIKKGDNRKDTISRFMEGKMDRMEMFYKYGLTQAGWNKYYEINLEYDNQIICKKSPSAH